MRRWTPFTATLLLLVMLLSTAGIVQGVVYPNNYYLNYGTVILGTFPGSIEHSDNDYWRIQSEGADVEYIQLYLEFDLNAMDNNQIVFEGYSSWTLISTCTQCFIVSVSDGSGGWRYLDDILWEVDTVRHWTLNDQEATQKPVELRILHQELDTTFLTIDQLYIDSWDDGGIVPPPDGDEPPDDDENGDDDETWWGDFDWLVVAYTVIFFILVFSLTWKVSGSIPIALVMAFFLALLFFLLVSGLIWTLIVHVGVIR